MIRFRFKATTSARRKLLLFFNLKQLTMEVQKEIRNKLVWHDKGKFEVEIVNGVIHKLTFCEPGKGPEDLSKALTSTDYVYLKAVRDNLIDLFNFLEKENKELGYSYSNPEENIRQLKQIPVIKTG